VFPSADYQRIWHIFITRIFMQLSDIVIQKIKANGAISFRDFMDMALYYPQLGYYTSKKDKIGKSGDYFTCPTLTPLFGFMLGKQIEEMWEKLGKKGFTIVEYGAGTGDLCENILRYLKTKPEIYEGLKYCIIEKSESMRLVEKQRLTEKVQWLESIEHLKDFNGCILSNELVDNFPVHQVIMKDELMELFVDYRDGFREVLKPASDDLKNYFGELKVTLPKGFRTEVNLQAIDWMKELGQNLNRGFVITIDYGYPSGELYSEYRRHGTITCYNKHRLNDKPYHAIGEQDITSHVNFSALCLWGFRNGLQYSGFRNQCDFLTALGFREYMKKLRQDTKDFITYKTEAFLSHTFLSEMGKKFKVLIQQKQVEPTDLVGLRPF
jgi:SAM-dependent MidA family methyltransferase